MGSGERGSDLSPEALALGIDELHVWRVCLARPAVESLYTVLSPGERERVARFRSEESRARFTVAHAALRSILGAYVGAAPTELRFVTNEYGKPALAGGEVRFNLAHAENLALVAVSQAGEVGVDVERIRANVGGEQIARRFFSESEVEAFLSLPSGDREPAFFRCWTRKEAFIKAVGEGLSFPLNQFDVTLAPGEPAVLATVRGSADEALHWTLEDVAAPDGYMAAVAVRARGVHIVCRDWKIST